MTFRVTETIHHGDYYNVQTSDGDTIAEAFREALRTSPYNFTVELSSNSYARDCAQSLVEWKSGDFGWAHYTVEELP